MQINNQKMKLPDCVSMLFAEVHRREAEIVLRLIRAVEYRDSSKGTHPFCVGVCAAALAEALGWNRDAVQDIRLAAAMHDIGNAGLPDQVLLKAGRLSSFEHEILKKHTEVGAELLEGSEIPWLRMARDIALSHHEWWDGTGYPAGLSGIQIPEAARVTAVVDVYDALMRQRPFRPGMCEEEAVATMQKEREAHFDPAIFDRFIAILPELRKVRAAIGSAEVSAGAG